MVTWFIEISLDVNMGYRLGVRNELVTGSV